MLEKETMIKINETKDQYINRASKMLIHLKIFINEDKRDKTHHTIQAQAQRKAKNGKYYLK